MNLQRSELWGIVRISLTLSGIAVAVLLNRTVLYELPKIVPIIIFIAGGFGFASTMSALVEIRNELSLTRREFLFQSGPITWLVWATVVLVIAYYLAGAIIFNPILAPLGAIFTQSWHELSNPLLTTPPSPTSPTSPTLSPQPNQTQALP